MNFKKIFFVMAILAIFLAAGKTPAMAGDYSRYDFNFCYNNGSGDYYTGYVYAPTSFQTNDLQFAVGTKLTEQPREFWDLGYQSFGGAYYEITAISNGYDASYDRQSCITAYYDADTAGASLGVNSDGSATAANIYVADRTAAYETGYAFSGANHASFSPYVEADVTLATANAYDFTFTYGSGDYYNGTVFAAPEYGYSASYTQTVTDEKGQTGTYAITGVTTGQEYSKAGQVYVANYYDVDSDKTYNPVNSAIALGTNYLGSESGYIIQSDWADYRFGGGYEADVDPNGVSLIDFRYRYADGSEDYLEGDFVAQDGEYSCGDIPVEMTGGYYEITHITPGYTGIIFDGERIYSYGDGGSGKSVPLDLSFSGIFAGSESGTIYDPSVPKTDKYYGNSNVVYAWTASESVDFLTVYYDGLPYWSQPSGYFNSCAVVAGAIWLAWLDQQPGYENIIPEDWSSWTTSSQEYVSFIGELATLMNWTSSGVYEFDMLDGLVEYCGEAGYDFSYVYTYPTTVDRTLWWFLVSTALEQTPLLLTIGWVTEDSSVYHEVVARGYWQNGEIIVNFGWGELPYANQIVDIFKTNYDSSSYQNSVAESCSWFY